MLVYAFTWAVTVLVRHSKTKVMETDTVDVPVMRGVSRDVLWVEMMTKYESRMWPRLLKKWQRPEMKFWMKYESKKWSRML